MKKEEVKKNAPMAQNEVSDAAKREEEMLQFWNEHDIFNKTLDKESPKGDFVFYDGPPFATGLPHYGHILAGTIKDAIPRFWTMNGFRVERKWGWDCHGLPLENIIEKRLGLATKRDIEALGVKNFNEAARDAVLEYADDWRRIVPRMGRFVDMEDDYKTMDASYTESVWWVFNELNRKGLVYEGFKSMHLCPRCGTTLSNFEVNQGYKDIKDIAVTVKLPLLDENGEVTDTSLLVWTTTPWTLPGNMAAAVHNDIEYVRVTVKGSATGYESGTVKSGETIAQVNARAGESFVLAKERLIQMTGIPYDIIGEPFKGSELVGKSYQPPFDHMRKYLETGPVRFIDFEENKKLEDYAWKIYHADYVELGEEGTGAVHLAPAYGEEDMELAIRKGVPIVHHVDHDGRFMSFVTDFAGKSVKPKDDEGIDHKDTDILILKKLQDTGKAFKKETITHSYPHCWRCDTPLLNYATTSWFVRVTDLKDKLVLENSKVQWVPEHVGRARFGKWLEGARDWAISRQRYWGAPLPIWKNKKTGTYKVFGSLAELQAHVPQSHNTYHFMRHGEAESNVAGHSSTSIDAHNPLTEKGRLQAKEAAEKLIGKGVTRIIASPFMRTKETAEIAATTLGIPLTSIEYDIRLGEVQLGAMDGRTMHEYHQFLRSHGGWCDARPEGGESWSDVKRRVGVWLYDIDTKYNNEHILVVAHNSPLRMLGAVHEGAALGSRAFDHDEDGKRYDNAEVRSYTFTKMPHNDNYELDFHRPYIDEIELFEDGEKLERVPDVFDCWFESGAMPYAQSHYPFEHKDRFDLETKKGYPADFIAESIDQTRGWFYSLIVLGVAITGKSPYQHVITNGLVLAEDGRKMSKKLQNYPDPIELANRVGADAIRYYLLSSPIIKGEDLNFSEKEVAEQQRKNVGRLHNVLLMYELYAGEAPAGNNESTHVLDRWILSRLSEVTEQITDGYTSYELDRATRPLEGLVDDLSVWYLRRSRERLKSDDETDKRACLATLRFTLKHIALLMAPVMPFYAEYLFTRVRETSDAESVHLMEWPVAGNVDTEVIEKMVEIRELIRQGLEKRQKEGLKVRQTLASLTVTIDLPEEYVSLIKEELNVEKIFVEMNANLSGSGVLAANLDTKITDDLKRKGDVREFIRAVQDTRKELGLNPSDRVVLSVDIPLGAILEGYEDEVKRVVGATSIEMSTTQHKEVCIGESNFGFTVIKQ